ncbi:polysaccharide biosynthesis tyrosine autokinase [Hyphomicrobium sp. 99]|uniref:GumC family protein n=1 Tax=Hyphomicrobium sp. 99 TaxID=1163419 RepID=UPI0005F876C1|nr:polysaccharide biosynthesis tyrosine autokinase [Hyphomicrobium sp. 99]
MTSPRDANSTPLTYADIRALEPNDPYEMYGGRGLDQPLEKGADFARKMQAALRILLKRKGLIFAVTVAAFSLGTVRTLMMTPLYTSKIRLQIDRSVAKIVEGGNITPVEGTDAEFLRTQYELLLSRSLAERVAQLARLADDQDFFRPRSFSFLATIRSILRPAQSGAPQSQRELVSNAAAIVEQNISVRPIPGSRLVDISYSDPNPARSQKISAAYANAFIASNLDKRFEANAYAKAFLEDQIKQLKLRLEQSEKAMLAFAEKEQIVSIGASSSMVETDLANSSAALGNIARERIKNEQLWRQVEKSDALNFPQFLSSNAIDGLRAKRNDLVTEYQEKLQTFKPSYPVMVQIKNKIGEVDRQLAAEVRTIRASLKNAYESSLSQENEITARVATLRTDVLDFQKRSIEYNILKREVDTNRDLYNGLLQRYKEVDVAGGVGSNNVFVVDAASLPSSPSSPQLMKSVLLALFLGFGISIALAYVIENFDDVIDSVEEAERVGGLVTLGVIPLVNSRVDVKEALLDARSPLAEAYRSLCTSLQFTTPRGMPKTLFVTSAGAQEGKSISSIAITQHFARLGLNVLLVDADMRNPSLHKYLEADNSVGLSSCLAGACTPPDAIQKTATPHLAFLSSGPLPPNAADLLASPHFMSLLSGSLEVFDLVIIDGPPVLGLADALLLSNAAEATIFVMGSGLARGGAVRSALKRLEISKGPLIGGVITKLDAKTAGYGYGYSYGYGADAFSYGTSVASVRSTAHTILGPS